MKKILLLPVKLLVLPLILLLKIVYLLAYLVTHIGTYILSPVILFVLGCGIWCAVQGRWTDGGDKADCDAYHRRIFLVFLT